MGGSLFKLIKIQKEISMHLNLVIFVRFRPKSIIIYNYRVGINNDKFLFIFQNRNSLS